MKYKLQYPHLPCLHLGSPNKNIYIPVELCEMKGQTLPMNKKLQDDETQAMIKATAIAPIERKVRSKVVQILLFSLAIPLKEFLIFFLQFPLIIKVLYWCNDLMCLLRLLFLVVLYSQY